MWHEWNDVILTLLVHHLWQGLALAALAALATRWCRPDRRDLIWAAAFGVIVLTPFLQIGLGRQEATVEFEAIEAPSELAVMPVMQPSMASEAPFEASNGVFAEGAPEISFHVPPEVTPETHVDLVSDEDSAQAPLIAASTPPPSSSIPWRSVFAQVATLALWFWLLGALWGMGRILHGLHGLRQLRRASIPLDAPWFEDLRRRAGLPNAQLRVHPDIHSPMVLGLGHPRILIPHTLLNTLSEDDMIHIALHELAHLKRGDAWTHLGQRIAEALFWPNIGLRWAGRRLDAARETACDRWAVAQSGDAKGYAACLVRVFETMRGRPQPLLAVSAAGGDLSQRVNTLLGEARLQRGVVSRLPVAVIIVCLAACGLLAAMIAPGPQLPAMGSEWMVEEPSIDYDEKPQEPETEPKPEMAPEPVDEPKPASSPEPPAAPRAVSETEPVAPKPANAVSEPKPAAAPAPASEPRVGRVTTSIGAAAPSVASVATASAVPAITARTASVASGEPVATTAPRAFGAASPAVASRATAHIVPAVASSTTSIAGSVATAPQAGDVSLSISRKGKSAYVHTSDIIALRMEGEVRFSDDETQIIHMSSHARFSVEDKATDTEVEVRADRNGDMRYRIWVDGREKSAADAQRWLSQNLSAMLLEAGIEHERRVTRWLEEDGVDGALANLQQARSQFVRGVYLHDVARLTDLSHDQYREVIAIAAQFDSDFEKARLFSRLMDKQLDQQVVADIAAQVGGINSDFERGRLLAAMLGQSYLSDQAAEDIIAAGLEIQSDFELSRFLRFAADRLTMQRLIDAGGLDVLSGVESDFEFARMVTGAMEAELGQDELDEILQLTAKSVGSDFEKSRILSAAAAKIQRIDTYLRVVDSQGGDYERKRSLGALIDIADLSERDLLAIADIIDDMGSDFEQAEVIGRILNRYQLERDVANRYRTLIDKLENHHRKHLAAKL